MLDHVLFVLLIHIKLLTFALLDINWSIYSFKLIYILFVFECVLKVCLAPKNIKLIFL